MANVIILWCDTLLGIKLPQLWRLKNFKLQGILGIYDNYNLLLIISDYLIQVYYKVLQRLSQSVTVYLITKSDGLLLKNATAFLLQSATVMRKWDSCITNYDNCSKVWPLLQSVTEHTFNSLPWKRVGAWERLF